jgi:hypothetical protein
MISIGPKSAPIVVSLTTYRGARLIDIRRYFKDKNTGDLLPTKKGLALQAKTFDALLMALESARDSITEWFEEGNEDSYREAENLFQGRLRAYEESARSPHDLSVGKDTWRSPVFFEIRSHGGKDVLTFNRRHTFTNTLEQRDAEQPNDRSGQDVTAVVTFLLASYSQAKSLLADTEGLSATELFAMVEYEWGIVLENYLQTNRGALSEQHLD